jgi:hypothetical protein
LCALLTLPGVPADLLGEVCFNFWKKFHKSFCLKSLIIICWNFKWRFG